MSENNNGQYDHLPALRTSRTGEWIVCDDLAMGRTPEYLVTVRFGRLPGSETIESLSGGRSEMDQELREAAGATAYHLAVERVENDGSATPAGADMFMPAGYLKKTAPELFADGRDPTLEDMLRTNTPAQALELWRTANAWYMLHPAGGETQ